jgi:hypothetical protein
MQGAQSRIDRSAGDYWVARFAGDDAVRGLRTRPGMTYSTTIFASSVTENPLSPSQVNANVPLASATA